MQKKSGLYIGETGETPIGKLWLAVSDLGLVAIECGLTQAEFEAYLVKRFKRTVEVAPERVRAVAGQLNEYLSGRQQAFTLDDRLDRAAALPTGRAAGHLRNPLW